jgi:hypothetical protein
MDILNRMLKLCKDLQLSAVRWLDRFGSIGIAAIVGMDGATGVGREGLVA